MHYWKRGVVLILGFICLILAAAAAVLAEPTPEAHQSDEPKVIQQSSPPEEASKAAQQEDESKSKKDVSAASEGSTPPVPPAGKELTTAELKLILAPIFENSKQKSEAAGKTPASEPYATKAAAPKGGLVSRIVAAGKRLVSRAMSWKGVRYVWGGSSRRGVDCSGLTQLIFAKEGIRLHHSARLQFRMGRPVSRRSLLAGDLVFFNTRGPISHVGMYIGDGKFIHAANRTRGVRVDYLNSPYYSKRYAGARRYLSN